MRSDINFLLKTTWIDFDDLTEAISFKDLVGKIASQTVDDLNKIIGNIQSSFPNDQDLKTVKYNEPQFGGIERRGNIMSVITDLISDWEDNIDPELRKLRFLSVTCESGVIGETCDLLDEEYQDVTNGLAVILSNIRNSLENFFKNLNELMKKEIGQDKEKAPEPERKEVPVQGQSE